MPSKPKICNKCGKEFPGIMVIDGKKRDLRCRRFCLECSPFNSGNRQDLTIVDNKNGLRKCTSCGHWLPESEFGPSFGTYHRRHCKKCYNGDVTDARLETKTQCVEYLGGKCIKCGYKRNIAALEFHHRESKEKEAAISDMLKRNAKFEEIKPELDKCDLMCSNCHRELHNPELNSENYITKSNAIT